MLGPAGLENERRTPDDPEAHVEDYWSMHPGGVNFLFTDGSVHFIKASISVYAWRGLATRNMGEIISADSYWTLTPHAIPIHSGQRHIPPPGKCDRLRPRSACIAGFWSIVSPTESRERHPASSLATRRRRRAHGFHCRRHRRSTGCCSSAPARSEIGRTRPICTLVPVDAGCTQDLNVGPMGAASLPVHRSQGQSSSVWVA